MSVTEYTYPNLSEKWDLWIIGINIERKLKKKPKQFRGRADSVTVEFDKPLTDEEKQKLDLLMRNVDVGLYPLSTEGYTIFKIKDIWDYRDTIEKAVGKEVAYLHFPEPLPDGTHIMELWIEGKLSKSQKEAVKRAYSGLISVVEG